jgi:hypothetical protein
MNESPPPSLQIQLNTSLEECWGGKGKAYLFIAQTGRYTCIDRGARSVHAGRCTVHCTESIHEHSTVYMYPMISVVAAAAEKEGCRGAEEGAGEEGGREEEGH